MIKLLIAAVLFSFNVAKSEVVELNLKNTVSIRTSIDTASVTEAQLKLQELVNLRGPGNYPIYIVLDSPGGSIVDGLDFIEFAKTVPNVKTLTLFAASMASAIVEALPGERLMISSGTMMFHRARAQIAGQVEEGELEARLNMVKKSVLLMEKQNAKRLEISLEQYKKLVVNEYWLIGEDAIAQKAVDKLVDVKCSKALTDKRINMSIDLGFFKIDGKVSGCPLIKGIEI